jgi:hypothetical protein
MAKEKLPIHPPELYFHFGAHPLRFGLVMQKELIFCRKAVLKLRPIAEAFFIKISQ